MIGTTAPIVPIALEERRAGITDRGRAVLAAYALQDAIRELDAADREYVAPLVADVLVDACQEPVALR